MSEWTSTIVPHVYQGPVRRLGDGRGVGVFLQGIDSGSVNPQAEGVVLHFIRPTREGDEVEGVVLQHAKTVREEDKAVTRVLITLGHLEVLAELVGELSERYPLFDNLQFLEDREVHVLPDECSGAVMLVFIRPDDGPEEEVVQRIQTEIENNETVVRVRISRQVVAELIRLALAHLPAG